KKFDLESVRTATRPYEAPKPESKNDPDNPINLDLMAMQEANNCGYLFH
ncbi:hypothetical protein Tco_1044537, partial [Tanacetum coccineum]